MKKSLLALAVLSAISGVASAQSSVTLSGIVDAGVRNFKDNYTLTASQSGYSSFTLSGREALSPTTYAFFTLNHRFNIGNGQTTANNNGTQAMWRNAFVGLGSSFGDIRLGRILMPLQDMNGGFDAFDTGYVGTVHTGGINATVRANNAIYYRSPSLGGLKLEAAIAASEGQALNEVGGSGGAGLGRYFAPVDQIGVERPMGVSLRYAAGPINLGLAYDINTFNQKTVGAYAAWNFGFMTLMGQYEEGDNSINATFTGAQQGVIDNEDLKVYSVSAKIPMGKFLFKAGYASLSGDRDGTKYGVGGEYILSKRTSLYSNVGQLDGARFNAVNEQDIAYDVGITHRF